MTNQQLEKINIDFNEYAKEFFTEDEYINQNLMMKLCHSKKVQAESIAIAKHLNIDSVNMNIASAIGLLHDIGRFKQFVEYKTYCDHRSINHSEIGIKELKSRNILKGISQQQAQLIIDAISYHNRKDIPEGITGDTLFHSKIVRDADKIDIFRVVLEYYPILRDNPDKFPLEIEFPDSDQYSQEIYRTVFNGEKVDYRKIRTMNDNRLLQAAWVYDLNFDISVKIIQDRKIIESLFDYLPKNRQIESLFAKIKLYIKQRTANIGI
jgi:putative nucleotidyltransferase with HDIG domain